MKRVAIIGLAFRFPGTSSEQYWPDLLAGRDLVSEIDPGRWALEAYLHPDKKHPGTAYTKAAGSVGEVAGFDADFFGISPREAALMDPQQRMLLELAWETIENAGATPASLRGSDCGVFVGIASTDYAWRVAEDLDVIDASMATGNAPSIAANRLSYVYDLHGPSVALDTACSSSMVAFHQACAAIMSGECGQALAGGISLHFHPYGFIGFSKATMLSPRGRCNVFDASADGYVRSEGGGLFLLKEYDQALADGNPILAVVAATAVNTDGRKSGLTIPSADAQAALMRRACALAGITPAQIDYLEAHGTGTPVGDPIEAHAIGQALGQPRGPGQALPIGSVKSNMGHLETASGVAGLVKAIHVLRHRVVPATIGVSKVNPNIKLDEWNLDIVTENRPLRESGTLRVGVNSFGFGGANAHVLLESAPAAIDAAADTPTQELRVPLVLSAKTSAAVNDYAAHLAEAFAGPTPPDVYAAGWQLARRRQWHGERAVVFAANAAEAEARLSALAENRVPAHLLATGSAVAEADAGPVLVYSGNGSQWLGMGRQLLADPVFAHTVAEIDALFVPLAGWSLADVLAQEHAGQVPAHGDCTDCYADTAIAQPALFAVQVGITRMLAQRGVMPSAVIGHSVGEVAAAWAAEILSLGDAVRVIYQRSRLQGLTRGSGQMSAVGLGGVQTQALLDSLALADQVHLAGINSETSATVAGAPDALETLEAHLAAQNTFFARLNLDYAFHSPAMDPVEGEVKQVLAGLAPGTGRALFYSTVTGTALAGTALDGDYWWRNIRKPVQFAAATGAAIGAGHAVFVEVGPHPVLRSYLGTQLKCHEHAGVVIATASRDGDEPARIDAAAGRVIASGTRIEWSSLFPHSGRHVDLPAYPWQRSRHWHPSTPESQGQLTRTLAHPLLGYPLAQHAAAWQQRIDTQSHPVLGDHRVGDAVVFPGAGYVELALAAARQYQRNSQRSADAAADIPYIELEALEIRAPLLLAAAPSKLVRVTLEPSDGRVRIEAKEQGADSAWSLHASTRILAQPGPALLPDAALQVPAGAADFTADEHVALTQAVGLAYGPAFCALSHGWHDAPDSVLAALSPHPSVGQELPHSLLHPALLDCAFQLTVHLFKEVLPLRQGVAFVPVQIGRLVLATGQGQPRYVRTRLLRRTPRSLVVNVDLYDASGRALAAAHEVRLRSVRLSKAADARLSFLDWVATPRPLPGSIAPAAIDAHALHQQLLPPAAETDQRYRTQVEPLLESLCDSYAAAALAALAAQQPPVADQTGARSSPDILNANTVEALCARTPELSALFAHVIQRALASGSACAAQDGWALTDLDAEHASAADIWNTLVRDYSDYFPAIHAVGRVGLHLPALLRGEGSPEHVRPSAITPGSFARLACGAASAQRISAAISTALSTAQARLAPGERLAVLEIGADLDGVAAAAGSGLPPFANTCTQALDPNRADYAWASANAAAVDQVRQQFAEHTLDASAYLIADNAAGLDTQGQDPAQVPLRADLVLVHGAFSSIAAACQALAHAAASLKPGAVLLWLGRSPAPWLDFLFGAQPDWYSNVDGQALPAQQPAAVWQEQLQALGLECAAAFSLDAANAAANEGAAYALIARRPALTDLAPAAAPRSIVLLANASGASSDLARALQASLTRGRHRCQILHDTLSACTGQDQAEPAPGALAAYLHRLLHDIRAQVGDITDIVHLDGWGAANAESSPADLAQTQVRRCTLAAALVQGCAHADGTPVSVWLLTSGATQALRFESTPSALARCSDAALWGYGRTLMNEANSPHCRVHLLDLPATLAFDSATAVAMNPRLVDALAREFGLGDDEDEILLEVNGARYAPRLREVPRPCPAQNPAAAPTSAARLGFDFPGQLRNLRWDACALAEPADDAVEVRVHATGLNFRDVMYALGLLSDEAVEHGFVGASLGLEFSGVITRVGRKVKDLQPGDAVLGFGPASFASHSVTPASTVVRIPEGMSFEAAATLPSVFLTVYYAFCHLAHVRAGEKVLIHGAAGGVGIAAIQLAQALGADIYATAGSDEKRDFLHLMGVQHIYDSRSLAWTDQILADTTDGAGHAGVDVVLNSLAGEAIRRNLNVLKPFGRFLELGKRDFYENTQIGLRPFRNNISYFGIDADQLMKVRPDLTRRLFGELMELFQQGQLHPLPYTAFNANDVVAAFRHMQQAGHIGKIVVTYQDPIKTLPPPPANAAQWRLAADASYLVTGGLGGFGLRSALWLADKGARHLILLGRRGRTADNEETLAALNARGVKVHAAACDVTDRAALAALLADTTDSMPPLKGIIHAAAVIQDALAVNATPAQIEANFAAKVLGALHLNELTQHTVLDFCIYYSSATTLFGNPGQSAYIAANSWLESLAHARRSHGLAATCVRWGAIDDAGFLARNESIKAALQSRMGGAALASRVALQALEEMLLAAADGTASANAPAVLELDWRALRRFLPNAAAPKFADIARHAPDDGQDTGHGDDIAHLLATLNDAELNARLVEMLKAELSEILRLPANKIDPARPVREMGLDSLMGVELVVALEARFGIRLPVMAMGENVSVETLAGQLRKQLRGSDDAEAEAAQDPLAHTVATLAASHAAEVSADSVAEFAAEFAAAEAATTAPPPHLIS